jgi:hypothetical protein
MVHEPRPLERFHLHHVAGPHVEEIGEDLRDDQAFRRERDDPAVEGDHATQPRDRG